MSIRNRLVIATLICMIAGAEALAGNVVVPNANTAVGGDVGLNTLARNASRTYQMVIAASQFANVPNLTPITGVTYRVSAGQAAWPPSGVTISYTDYTIQLARAVNAPGSMSTTFASNIGPDVVTCRTGAMTVTPLSYPAGAPPAPFGVTLNFTTPYVYHTGDNLVITFRHSGNGNVTSGDRFMDALNTPGPANGYGVTVQAVSATGNSATAGAAAAAVIMRFTYEGLGVDQTSASPTSVIAGDTTTLNVRIGPATTPPSTGITVSVNLSAIGGSSNQTFFDDGAHGDGAANDNVFGFVATTSVGSQCGNLSLPVTAHDAQGRTAVGAVPLQVAVPITIDPDAIPENEPGCGVPDTTNGGCNSTPNIWSPISCGQKISGTVQYNGTTRDTDWYQIDLPQTTRITWKAKAEFDLVCGILNTGGVAGCPVAAFLTNGVVVVPPCQEARVSACLGAGTWYLFIAPNFTHVLPCGRKYQAQVFCGCACPGDMNNDLRLDGDDIAPLVNLLLTLGNPASIGDCTDANFCADADGDHDADDADVAIIVSNLLSGTGCN